MALDLIIRGARIPDAPGRVDLGVRDGRLVRIGAPVRDTGTQELDVGGRLVIPGLVESHFHLDKALLGAGAPADAGSVAGAIRATAEMKRRFTREDIAARARRALELAIRHGTTAMRTHVEVDPIVGLMGMEAILPLKREYAWAIDLQICVFPQEGILQAKGTEALMRRALAMGGEVVGGVPYNDTDPLAHLDLVFDLAREFDRDVDLHLDFADDADRLLVGDVADRTIGRGWRGRVCAGHMSALGALVPDALAPVVTKIREAGISILVLPATDLYLMGRNDVRNVRRGLAPARRLHDAGVNVAVSTNNVQNPFTPFGDASLLRMANFYANVAHAAVSEFDTCLDLVTDLPARLMNLKDYGITIGNPADLIVLDTDSGRNAIAELPDVLTGFKNGRQVFERSRPVLFPPQA